MKVRILKAEKKTYWYAAQIGCVFNVQQSTNEYSWRVSGMEEGHYHYIVKSDCEILPEENQPEPFDLERALKGEKVITRDNKEVTEIYHFKTNKSEFCVVAIVEGAQFEYLINGSYESPNESKMDLFMAPRESEYVTKWVGLFNDMSRVDCRLFDKQEDVPYSIPVPITFKRPS